MPNNKTIYLVRHGLATIDPSGYGDSKMTAGLLPQGVGAVEKMARFLKDVPDSCNFSSPVPRCRQTAEIISRITGKAFGFDKRLTEFHGETFAAFQARVRNFTRDLSLLSQDNIIICSHSAVLSGIRDFVIRGSFTYRKEYNSPREGELLVVRGRKSRVLSFNGTETCIFSVKDLS